MPKSLSNLKFFQIWLLIAAVGCAPVAFGEPATSEGPGHFDAYLGGLLSAQFTDHKLADVTVSVIYANQPLLLKGYDHSRLGVVSAVCHRHRRCCRQCGAK